MSLILVKTPRKKHKGRPSLKNNPAIYTYGAHDETFDDDDFREVLAVLVVILSLYWAVVHLLDAVTFDYLVWWIEPLTIIPFIAYLAFMEFGQSKNPLHWWHLTWGYKVPLANNDVIVLYPIDRDALVKKWGGPYNVHVCDSEHIKFRRKKDAVFYSLTN